MRKLFALLLILPVLGAVAYWFAVSTTVERSLAQWFEDQRRAGWVSEFDVIESTGFPLTIETQISGIELADPTTGVSWFAPNLHLSAPSTSPNQITVTWPSTQTVSTPIARYDLSADRFVSDINFLPNSTLALGSAETQLENLIVSPVNGDGVTILQQGNLSTVLLDGATNRYDVKFDARQVTPASDVLGILDPTGLLPTEIDGVLLDAQLTFDAPWDRLAIERARPQITRIALSDLRAVWGDVELRAAGELDVDELGRSSGQITVKATNWREMVVIAENTGLLPTPFVPTVTRALELLAGLNGPAETLDAPLSFREGFVSFGPFPIGRAPNFRLR